MSDNKKIFLIYTAAAGFAACFAASFPVTLSMMWGPVIFYGLLAMHYSRMTAAEGLKAAEPPEWQKEVVREAIRTKVEAQLATEEEDPECWWELEEAQKLNKPA